MEANSETVLGKEQGETDEAQRRSLPYSFAKRHGVLIRSIDEHEADAVYRSGVTPMSLRSDADEPCGITPICRSALEPVAGIRGSV
jgi:hypothetical protein